MVNKKKKKSKGRLDRQEAANWLMFTIIYVMFVGFLNGVAIIYFPTIIYIFGVPFATQQSVVVLGFAGWGIISVSLNYKYSRS